MTKTIRISLDDSVHIVLTKYKGKKTWYDVLMRGIASLSYWPEETYWVDACRENNQKGIYPLDEIEALI